MFEYYFADAAWYYKQRNKTRIYDTSRSLDENIKLFRKIIYNGE